jgi:hypothetical protein
MSRERSWPSSETETPPSDRTRRRSLARDSAVGLFSLALTACESPRRDSGTTEGALGGETTVMTSETTRRSPDTVVGAGQVTGRRDTSARARTLQRPNIYDVTGWRPGNPGACGLPEPAAPPSASGDRSVTVFFGCQPASGTLLNAVPARRASVPAGRDARENALRVLLGGPTPDEKRAGYLSNFGPGTANVGFTLRVQSGTATVDFDSAIRNVKFIFVSMMDVAQIVATLGQFPEVRRVQILIGGQEWCLAMGEC